jgi:hypothetical protein
MKSTDELRPVNNPLHTGPIAVYVNVVLVF